MHYHLLLTDHCNLCCTYCRGKAFLPGGDPAGPDLDLDWNIPAELDVDLDRLYAFLARDPSPVLTFYGGEPLLRTDLIREIMAHAPVKRFLIQTNGLLLDRVDPDLLLRFATILVSLDGPRDLTDRYRGTGTYDAVMRGLRRLRSLGFRGELIARMTVAEATDIEESVLHLAECPDHPFTSLHWQLDANFSGDYRGRDFARWAETSYLPGIRKLAARWVEEMGEHGRVLRWYPFLDTTEDLLLGLPSRLRCGSGHANYSILTDGSLSPCPIMSGMRAHYVGHIAESDPANLPQVPVGGECASCELLSFCGGRCLFASIMRPWPREARKTVCATVQGLHDTLIGTIPAIRGHIAAGRIRMEDFAHEKYNGCEIIP
ncbi:MAG: TIGR04084 family radical SAM/SPASM domain-containing protein [Methanomicrobiales archaeon]|nr:TIGR04084 family radical SAM/SPASM domain-containing protein [Methanomicrobiales archaeon]